MKGAVGCLIFGVVYFVSGGVSVTVYLKAAKDVR